MFSVGDREYEASCFTWDREASEDVRPHPGPLPRERENRSPRFEPCPYAGLSCVSRPIIRNRSRRRRSLKLSSNAPRRTLFPGERVGVRASVTSNSTENVEEPFFGARASDCFTVPSALDDEAALTPRSANEVISRLRLPCRPMRGPLKSENPPKILLCVPTCSTRALWGRRR